MKKLHHLTSLYNNTYLEVKSKKKLKIRGALKFKHIDSEKGTIIIIKCKHRCPNRPEVTIFVKHW
jgi:hypothetical protein